MEDKELMDRRSFIRTAGGFVVAGAAGSALGPFATTPSGVVFHSDWSTALGRQAAAIRDLGKSRPWQIYIGGQQRGNAVACAVIPARGLGFPTTNCLQVDCIVGIPHNRLQEFHTGQVSNLPGGGAWRIPAAGESLYYRMYKRLAYPHHVSEPPPAGNNNHCVEERSGSATNWSWNFSTGPEGWNPSFNVWVDRMPTRFRLGGARPTFLARDQVYRLEWALHRTNANRRRHDVRIHDREGRLLYSTEDFTTGRVSLAGFEAPLSHGQLDALQMGTNGMGFNPPNEPTQSVVPAWYFAGVAVRNSGWCGPYSNGI